MKKKVYVIPKQCSYIKTVIPHIYYPKEIENVDKGFIDNVFNDNGLVFEIIDDEYYVLNYSNYTKDSSEIKKTARKFTSEEIDKIKSYSLNNYIKEKEVNDDLEEIVATLKISGDISGNTDSPVSCEVTLKLTNDTFKGISSSDDVKSWFTNEDGEDVLGDLTANTKTEPEESNSKLVVTIAGSTSSEVNKKFKVTIPNDKLNGNKSIESCNKLNINISNAIFLNRLNDHYETDLNDQFKENRNKNNSNIQNHKPKNKKNT